MKRAIILIFLILMIFPLFSAINLNIEKLDSTNVMVAKINRPTVFNLKITNYGESDNFRFDNFLGFRMFPIGTVKIDSGETKDIQLSIFAPTDFKYRGFYNFQYIITGNDLSNMKEDLTVKIIDLKESFKIGSGEFNPKSNSIKIYIKNKENFDFGNMNVLFSSPFFSIKKEFTLGPNEKKEFVIELNKEDFKKLMAGFYTLNAEINVEKQKTKIEGIIKFSEEDILKTTSKDYGLILNTKIIKKTNNGNIVTSSKITIKKNIISRLFTTFNPEPDVIDRQGFYIYYTWSDEVKPGEFSEVIVKTNWIFPLIILGFILLIVILAKQYSKSDLVLKKKVTFVHAKGGEFALKVSIFVSAKEFVERINIIDKVPPLVKIYEKFGREIPSKVDSKNRKIEWNIEKLDAGESRVFSYIIYSKIGVLGKFALPSTTAVYEKEGKIKESESNRAFFIAEQGNKEIEE